MSNTATEHFIQADGVRIRYLEAGQGSPVIILHSAEGLTPSPFDTLLAQQFRVIALEVQPLLEKRPSSHRDVARTLAQAVGTLGLDRFVLVSSSVGTSLALWLALQALAHIEALVLISPPALLPEDQRTASGTIHDPELERRLQDIQVATLVLRGTNDASAPSETGRLYVERLPDSYYVLVYDAGHAIEAERPEALFAAVRDFVEHRGAFIVEHNNMAINP